MNYTLKLDEIAVYLGFKL